MFNSDRVLRWRLNLEQCGTEIGYIKGQKNIVVETLSIFPLDGNQETTLKSTYKKEIVSEINDTKEIPEGKFPVNLKWIKQQQRK